MLDIYTIIFLALAVFIFLRLRSVLGQRTGHERPPIDTAPDLRPKPGENVVRLPTRAVHNERPDQETPAANRWEGVAEPGSPLERTLNDVVALDTSFDLAHFLGGARAAYEMIVTAFANGDRRMLRDLLAKDVYDGFVAAIADREARGETVESRFVAIDKAELVGADLKDRVVQLTVRFVSQLVSVTRDKAGAVVDGNANQVTDVTDIWTFSRDLGSRDPNWKLIATEAA
ncbi:Tim44-like domain protein [Blastochloris viridis]|nr:Tim44-like domain protein [Blastochloris viridis]